MQLAMALCKDGFKFLGKILCVMFWSATNRKKVIELRWEGGLSASHQFAEHAFQAIPFCRTFRNFRADDKAEAWSCAGNGKDAE